MSRALVWMRRDLRIEDHRPLAEACAASREVAVAFVFDTTILDHLHDRDDRRVTFIHDSLVELDRELRSRGSMLIVRYGDPRHEIPELVRALAADALFFGRDYEPAAVERDDEVERLLTADGISVTDVKDHVLFDGDELLTGSGRHFRVFTPYRNAWMKKLAATDGPPADAEFRPDLTCLLPSTTVAPLCHDWSLENLGFQRNRSPLVEAGRSGGIAMLARFEAGGLNDYSERRDIPSVDGTSTLGIHLRFGTLSIRELVRTARDHASDGAATWLNELVWRDFFQMILRTNPASADQSLRPEFQEMNWPGTEACFETWCRGETGYPIVDAAMRSFNQTGWMHNRLRMIVASFLVKDLLVDWRWGERYFARYLLDYDRASNVGNWQWAASTGTDAQPWFRIFNPVVQSRKFDPSGEFIRRHIPELAGFDNRGVHWPAGLTQSEQESAGCIVGSDYPEPIVDHGTVRERTLELFRGAVNSSQSG